MDKSMLLLFNILHAQIRLPSAFLCRSTSAEGTRFLLPHPFLPPWIPGGIQLCASALQRAIIFCCPQLCNGWEKCDFFAWCRLSTGADGGVGIKANQWTVGFGQLILLEKFSFLQCFFLKCREDWTQRGWRRNLVRWVLWRCNVYFFTSSDI